MNQIIFVKNENKNFNKNKQKTFSFKAQFVFSIALIFILLSLFIYFRYSDQYNYIKNASKLSNNYNVYRLYNSETSTPNVDETASIIGSISIPKININYPIISDISENLLKISPCRFNGDISDDSNLCIAGHNFDNGTFFSKLPYLSKGDKITITDNSNNSYIFRVFDNYEVNSSDTSSVYNDRNVNNDNRNGYNRNSNRNNQNGDNRNNNFRNNQNNNRIIIKASLEK